MSEYAIHHGDKLHIITRRLFQQDLRRHFVGEVMRGSGNLFEIEGYSFVYEVETNRYRRGSEPLTRVFSVGDALHIVNKLPNKVNIESLHYSHVDDRLVVCDREDFSLDINEFGPRE